VDRIETYGCVANPVSDSLGVILTAVNPDYDKLALILRFELPQLRENMDTVDSAIGPEVQKNYFPP
jgi:hypothetical protein